MARIALIVTFTIAAASAPAMKCPDIVGASFGPDVKIESAKLMPATAKTPGHCDVRGTIWPENKFALKLPTDWNGRFQMVGNGGTAGTISLGPVDNGVRLGYAAASTDTGHDAAREPLATFGKQGPGNPNAERKILDFGYLAVHETAALSKKIIAAYYGKAAHHSYWVGCSTGGRQGFSEAQRYPEDFDGLVIGAPALNITGLNMRMIWNGQASSGPGEIKVEKMPALAAAVYGKCDALDGLKDGIIDDPRKCRFNPGRDLPKCAAGHDAASCFTPAQISTLERIYGGVKNSAGKLLFPGQLPGAEVSVPAGPEGALKSGWENYLVAPATLPLPRAESYMRYIFLKPPPADEWTYRDFNFDKDPARAAQNAHKVNALNPDLRPLKKRGGRILHYQGWGDAAVIAQVSLDYRDALVEKLGAAAVKEFYRLYMVPGMFHCTGGVGCSAVDWLTPMVEWVEKGVAPAALTGARVERGETRRTRPVCPYPQVARYKGTGSIDEAANFACAEPAPSSGGE
ncbi:MAG TPA: tannase/feruloyl esterase family alpha/beta hydrolase [Bryobacteraceae bacterium]|nr:tannase/feruloyl esterase family alpha/beta hydrolase [Bryobacteraceae bacterium]